MQCLNRSTCARSRSDFEDIFVLFRQQHGQDFGLYDVPHSNPLRELVPLTLHYPSLLQIIIANSALHMSNASGKFLTARLPSSSCPSSMDSLQSRLPISALMVKQQTLVLLHSSLSTMTLEDLDVMLAIVLLFVQCEFMDSGKNDLKHHIRGARSLIQMVYESGDVSKATMSTLRRYFQIKSTLGIHLNRLAIFIRSYQQNCTRSTSAQFYSTRFQLARACSGMLRPTHDSNHGVLSCSYSTCLLSLS